MLHLPAEREEMRISASLVGAGWGNGAAAEARTQQRHRGQTPHSRPYGGSVAPWLEKNTFICYFYLRIRVILNEEVGEWKLKPTYRGSLVLYFTEQRYQRPWLAHFNHKNGFTAKDNYKNVYSWLNKWLRSPICNTDVIQAWKRLYTRSSETEKPTSAAEITGNWPHS